MNVIEAILGMSILSLAAIAATSAMLTGSHVVAAPAARDQALTAARNAAVEARAVSAYDANAADAIRSAPLASWNSGAVALQSSTQGGSLVIVAIDGAERATVRYDPVREALPQGAIVDASGSILSP